MVTEREKILLGVLFETADLLKSLREPLLRAGLCSEASACEMVEMMARDAVHEAHAQAIRASLEVQP